MCPFQRPLFHLVSLPLCYLCHYPDRTVSRSVRNPGHTMGRKVSATVGQSLPFGQSLTTGHFLHSHTECNTISEENEHKVKLQTWLRSIVLCTLIPLIPFLLTSKVLLVHCPLFRTLLNHLIMYRIENTEGLFVRKNWDWHDWRISFPYQTF